MSMWANHQETRRRAQAGAEECHATGDAARHHDMYARHRPAPWHRERQMRAEASLRAYWDTEWAKHAHTRHLVRGGVGVAHRLT